MLSYTRRRKINPDSKNIKVDFVDELGDKWEENTVYHHGVKTWMDITGKTDVKESPYHGATSNDVDWMTSVEIQAVAQKWITHSISKTCNLPNDATRELVSDVYMKAWESKCKGFTIYRDGSRSGVLVAESSKEKKESIASTNAPKRPSVLPCEVYHTKSKGEDFFVIVRNASWSSL